MAGSTQKLADLVRSIGRIGAALQSNYAENLQDTKPKFEALNEVIGELTPNLVTHGSSNGNLAKTPAAKNSFNKFETALGELVEEFKQEKYNDSDINPHKSMLEFCKKNLVMFQGQAGRLGRG